MSQVEPQTEPPTLAQRFEKMKDHVINTYNGLEALNKKVIKLDKRVEELEAATPKRKPRTIRADPKNIAIARNLLDVEGYTLQDVQDSGVLTYNKTYGLSKWTQDYFEEFAEKNGVLELYESGRDAPEFLTLVPNPNRDD